MRSHLPDFSNDVLLSIKLIDEVLEVLGQPKLTENPDFVFDESSVDFRVDIRLKKEQRAKIVVIIMGTDLQIEIDRVSELYLWDVTTDGLDAIRDVLTMIFTCSIVADHYGRNLTRLTFRDQFGESVSSIKVYSGLCISWRRRTRTYLPVY